jgi:hypothetical protein
MAIHPYSYQITTNHQLLLTIYFLLITIYASRLHALLFTFHKLPRITNYFLLFTSY